MGWAESTTPTTYIESVMGRKKRISIGRWSAKTELAIQIFNENKKELKESLKKYKELLKRQARICKFEKINW